MQLYNANVFDLHDLYIIELTMYEDHTKSHKCSENMN